MKLVVVAVGTRMPRWVDEGFAEYAARLPREMPLQLVEVKPEPRSSGKPVAVLKKAEAERLRASMPARCRRVVLDERGTDLTTRVLSERLAHWSSQGDDIAFIIGGPDGLDDSVKKEADETMRLSSLTLPHGMARVMLAEALYRAASLLKGHPYHRE